LVLGRSVWEHAVARGTSNAARVARRVGRIMASSWEWRRSAVDFGAGRKGNRVARRLRLGAKWLSG
jgi:hypothetical protein